MEIEDILKRLPDTVTIKRLDDKFVVEKNDGRAQRVIGLTIKDALLILEEKLK